MFICCRLGGSLFRFSSSFYILKFVWETTQKNMKYAAELVFEFLTPGSIVRRAMEPQSEVDPGLRCLHISEGFFHALCIIPTAEPGVASSTPVWPQLP